MVPLWTEYGGFSWTTIPPPASTIPEIDEILIDPNTENLLSDQRFYQRGSENKRNKHLTHAVSGIIYLVSQYTG